MPHGFGCLPVEIPWEIFPHCRGVGGARPRARHLHDSSDHEIVGLHLSLSSPGHNSPARGSFVQCPGGERTAKKRSVDEKSSEDQKLFSFGEEFFREKSASAGGRRGTTQPSHTGHAGPWLPGASCREPGLRGPEGPEDPTERKRDH